MSLKNEIELFGELFKQCVNGSIKATMRWVSCEAVDWDNKTMTATDGDELEFKNVLLGVNAVVVKPALKSDCLIAIIENDEATAFLISADVVEAVDIIADKIQVNGGDNGGLIIIKALTDKLNALVEEVNGIRSALKSHSHTVVALPNPAGVAISTAEPTVVVGEAKAFDREDYENTNVIH